MLNNIFHVIKQLSGTLCIRIIRIFFKMRPRKEWVVSRVVEKDVKQWFTGNLEVGVGTANSKLPSLLWTFSFFNIEYFGSGRGCHLSKFWSKYLYHLFFLYSRGLQKVLLPYSMFSICNSVKTPNTLNVTSYLSTLSFSQKLLQPEYDQGSNPCSAIYLANT